MNVTFYNNQSDNNVVDKDLVNLFTTPFAGALRTESSVMSPVITIAAPASSFVHANYAYIDNFERYYYIEDITSIRSDLTQIAMRVDVLMSYKDQIRQSSALVKRNAYQYNLLINDGSLAAYANGHVLAYKFSGGFTDDNFVLIVAGGA